MLVGSMGGRLEVICGPMFSGKTEELIRRVKRLFIARQKVQVFKPKIDDRYSESEVVSHSSQTLMAQPVDSALDLFNSIKDSTRVVAIDEVQFFDSAITAVVEKCLRRGLRVICAGLDLDYRAQPFGVIPHLLALADEVQKLHSICTVCGQPATRSQRVSSQSQTILVGEKDSYEARCTFHYDYEDDDDQLALPFESESARLQKRVASKKEEAPTQ